MINQTLLPSLKTSLRLMRFQKPIGTLLLLWPTLWALWMAAGGRPPVDILCIFLLGVFIMRSAGCVVNDLVDRHIDPHVERTRDRPLPQKETTPRNAFFLLLILLTLALGLVLFLNIKSLMIACIALVLASIYPFVKRFSYFPQVVLGLAFSCAIPMVFAAVNNDIPWSAGLLILANCAWIIGYDTYYAMVDHSDDLRIGVKSTSVFMGDNALLFIYSNQALMMLCLCLYGVIHQLNLFYYLGLGLACFTFVYQSHLARTKGRAGCLRAFLANNYSGLLIFIGFCTSLL